MNEVDKHFLAQDEFRAKMIDAYKQQIIPQWYAFRPYFEWKMGLRGCDFTGSEITTMRSTTVRLLNKFDTLYPTAWDNVQYEEDNIFSLYNGFGKDREVVCYLNNIYEELLNFIMLRAIQ